MDLTPNIPSAPRVLNHINQENMLWSKKRKMMENSPQFGERLLPQVVDQYAFECPNRVFGCYPVSNDVSQGFREVTMKQLACAVDFMAWWIKESIGISNEFETVSFMGTSDFRYPIFCLAAIKCGFKVLLPGTRNSVVQIKSLLHRTSCKKMFHSSEMTTNVKQIGVGTNLEVPAMEVILASESPRFPYEKAFVDAENDPILVIHSSGTTGDPKIIVMTHGTVSVTDSDRFVPCPEGRKPQNGAQFNFEGGGGFYSCFPPYHLAGLQACLILPIFSNSASIILGPPQVPPSGQLMVEILKQQKEFVRAFYVPPSMIDQWGQNSDCIEQAKQLSFILYGGGPLPPAVGDKLCRVTDVCQMYGSAETGQIQLLVPQKGEWSYMEWNPFEEIDMQPSVEGTFEMVLHQEPRFWRHRSLSHNFPAVQEWRSGDLFVPHPTKAGLWRYHGRMDDLIVLANSHKINPVSFETHVSGHPLISGALVIGTNRFQPALLLELSPGTTMEKHQLIEEIWPLVKHSNTLVPQYAQITLSKILFATPDRPFVRSPKGSIVRKLTIVLYTRDIEEMYSHVHVPDVLESIDCTTSASILHWLRESLKVTLHGKQLEDDDDFFSSGMDSLIVAEYTNMLRSAVRDRAFDPASISVRTIYQNPTTSQLATAIQSLVTQSSVCDVQVSMDDLINRYSQFPPSKISPSRHVILTGATGSLGSHVLELLLKDPDIETIFCLVRPNSSKTDLHLKLSTLERVELICIDISLERLGLDDATYKLLTSKVDIIIHLAWSVDFNLSLQSFETHLRGLHSIIELSINNPLKPQILFSSSTAYATDWFAKEGKDSVPESLLPNSDSLSSGYGNSKQVAEWILSEASCNGVPVTVLRIGQIAGSINSEGSLPVTDWSKNEWVLCMIETSKAMNLIPFANIEIDWITVDAVAQIIKDSMTCPDTSKDDLFRIHNVVNPKATPWTAFVEALQETLPSATVVPLQDWVETMISHDSTDVSELSRLPALKLKSFFQGFADGEQFRGGKTVRFITEQANSASKTFSTIEALDYELIRSWCRA